MGFYPFMKCEVFRATVNGERMIRARVFDEVLSKWVTHDTPGYESAALEVAWQWALKHLMMTEM